MKENYNTDRFSPIDILVKCEGRHQGNVLHGYIDMEADGDVFYSEPNDGAELILNSENGNWVEVEQDENGNWVEVDWDAPLFLTPKGCFIAALGELKIIDENVFETGSESEKTLEHCFNLFENRMKKNGYIEDSSGNLNYSEKSKKPVDIFLQTVNAYYPGTNLDQREAAWEIFIDCMDKHGNLRSHENSSDN